MGEPHLLERAPELRAVEDLVTSAVAGRPGCLLMDGPAGIGKTSLLDRAVSSAEALGVRVRRAVGDDLETGLPFGLARRLFPDVDVSGLTGPAALAAPVLAPDVRVAGSGDLFPLLHGLHWLVAELTEGCPHVLVLDDIQWSDPQTLRFVNYLLNRLDGLHLGVVLAARTGSYADADIAGLADRLRDSAVTRVHHLGGLGGASVAELVRRRLARASDSFCAAVARTTHGNPFLCEELLSTVLAEGISPDDEGVERLGTLQHTGIRTSILVRLGQLGHDPTAAAAAAAVLGSVASVGNIAKVAGLDEERAEWAVDLLVAAEILTARADGLDFVHPIIKETVYADIGPGRRAASHRRVAALLVDQGADVTEVATHVLAAGGAPDPLAVPALLEAASAAMGQGAPERAAELLDTALGAGPDADLETRVLVELGRAEAACGRGGALDRFGQALSALSGTEHDAAVAKDIGSALYAAGQYDEARRAFERGLGILDRVPRDVEGELLEAQLVAGLDMTAMLTGERPDRLERFPSGSVEHRGAPSLASRALACLAAGRHAFGVRVPAAAHTHAVVVGFAERALDGPPLPLELGPPVLEPLALSLFITRSLGPARDLLDRLVRTAAERGDLPAYASLVTVRGEVHLAAGELALAAADGADAVALGAELPSISGQVDAAARHVVACASLMLGDEAAAERAVAVDDADARWSGSVLFGWYHDAVGRVELHRGNADGARRAFEAAGESFQASGGPGAFCPWRSGAALAAHASGDRDDAVRWADEELRLARRFGTPGPVGQALRVRALVGRADAAVPLLHEAVQLLSGGPALELAAAEIDLGAAVRRAGHRSEARQWLRTGLDRARACGATPMAEMAAGELEIAGARRPATSVTGVEALTPSERRVADLAVNGMSNREIAAALFVTRKTVEIHLSACYRKLAISSRHQLADALAV